MKLVAKQIFILLLIVAVFTQCKKKTTDPVTEEPTPTPTPTGINTVAEIITANGAQNETFTISATQASTIITAAGVKIEIPANSLETTTSGSVAGTVTVTVKTITNKGQIIASGAGANSSSSKLVSTKGCVKITASQSSQQLRLTPSSTVVVNVPDGTTAPTLQTKKFYASKITAVDSTKFWELGTDVSAIPTAFDAGLAKYVHKARLDSLKWLNVGAQWDSVGVTKVPVIANIDGSKFTKNNTMVYLSLNGSLTVGALFEISNGVFRISNMPVGKAANIVAIAVINGQYYTAVQSITISSTAVNLNMQAVSQTQMISQINALP